MPAVSRSALAAVPDHPLAGDTARVTVAASAGPARPFVLLLDARGRVTSEFDLIFPGLPAHASGAARFDGDDLVVTPAVAGGEIRRIVAGLLRGADAGAQAGIEIDGRTYALRAAPDEPAVILAEFVRTGDGWSCRRAGYGVASAALLADRFRAEPGGAMQRRLETYLSALAPPTAVLAPPPRPTLGLIVGSVSLDRGESAAVARGRENFHVALNWSRPSKDLDLYGLYVDDAGRSGACYYRQQGSLTGPPYVCLTSGDCRGRETVEVSPAGRLRYVLICAYSAVENGYGSFASFGAFAEVDNGAGAMVQVPLHHRNRYSYWVAIALVDLSAPDRIAVRHVERYSSRDSEARPVLYADGTFRMDAGPVEFKYGRPG